MLDESLHAAQESGNPQEEFRSSFSGQLGLGPHEQEKWYLEAIRVNEQHIGSQQNALMAKNNLALLYGAWDRAEEAAEVFESVRQSAQQMGLRYHYAMATGNLGQYRLSLNQVREGERHLKESIELCKALGAVIWHHFVPALSIRSLNRGDGQKRSMCWTNLIQARWTSLTCGTP